jgi:hypothetical protein
VAIVCVACVCMVPAAYAAKGSGSFTKESIQAY